ncbi:MAG: hypothetical protein J5700_05610, partial [Treponema sp.]|nr:hypothetical protein [Treponema sp.]
KENQKEKKVHNKKVDQKLLYYVPHQLVFFVGSPVKFERYPLALRLCVIFKRPFFCKADFFICQEFLADALPKSFY